MKKIICDKLPRILKSKKTLEEKLGIKISNRGKEVFISGNPEQEYIAEKIIDAINMGFSLKDSLLIKEEDYLFEILNLKDYSKTQNFERVRGRLIGKDGKTKKTISHLTKCILEIKGNLIGIIGPAENIRNAQEAIISLIKGSKQANIYAHLEKHQVKPITDLGLKKEYENL